MSRQLLPARFVALERTQDQWDAILMMTRGDRFEVRMIDLLVNTPVISVGRIEDLRANASH